MPPVIGPSCAEEVRMRDGAALPLMIIGRHTSLAYFPAPRRVFIYSNFMQGMLRHTFELSVQYQCFQLEPSSDLRAGIL
jgi:hypothetical protein